MTPAAAPAQIATSTVILGLAISLLVVVLVCDWIATTPANPRWADDDDSPDEP